jgi:hypothetical protein
VHALICAVECFQPDQCCANAWVRYVGWKFNGDLAFAVLHSLAGSVNIQVLSVRGGPRLPAAARLYGGGDQGRHAGQRTRFHHSLPGRVQHHRGRARHQVAAKAAGSVVSVIRTLVVSFVDALLLIHISFAMVRQAEWRTEAARRYSAGPVGRSQDPVAR